MPGLGLGIHLLAMDCRVERPAMTGSEVIFPGPMSPDPLFWYGLALKMAMTATIVVLASVAVERSGPFIGALIAALPTAASAAYIILALEHPPAFIAASAIGSLAANAAVAVFALAYAVLAQRHGIVLSIGVATLVWFAAAAALRLVEWTPAGALALNAVVFAVTIPASARYRHDAVPRQDVKRRRGDIRAARRHRRAGGRGGDDGEQPDRLVRLRHVRRIPDRDGKLRRHPASARRRPRRRCRARARAARRSSVSASAFSEFIISPGRSACGGPTPPAWRSRWRGAACSGSCAGRGCDRLDPTCRSRACARG